jgi:hypothetical protein
MAVLTIEQSSEIAALIRQANDYKGDNVYQDVFYQSGLVDVGDTADADEGVVILTCGDRLMWDEQRKEWC